ncbi:MAG: HAD domain-containing protein [Candidatus Pacearchaeota archaeon]|jgi:hypothetical protein|nr:HAD domain-containing protein [Clostridia bacterium]
MKIIFLDIDGVLNIPWQATTKQDRYGDIFHPDFVRNLAILIDATDAKIVMTSTWKDAGLQTMQNMWNDRELPGELIDITPSAVYAYNFITNNGGGIVDFDDIRRGDEIDVWITKHLDKINIESFVIIDDINGYYDYQQEVFVQTANNFDVNIHRDNIRGFGLTEGCVERAIAILDTDEYIN